MGGIKCYRIGLHCLSSSDGSAPGGMLVNWIELSFFLFSFMLLFSASTSSFSSSAAATDHDDKDDDETSVFQGPRGFLGPRGRPGPAGPPVSCVSSELVHPLKRVTAQQ